MLMFLGDADTVFLNATGANLDVLAVNGSFPRMGTPVD